MKFFSAVRAGILFVPIVRLVHYWKLEHKKKLRGDTALQSICMCAPVVFFFFFFPPNI